MRRAGSSQGRRPCAAPRSGSARRRRAPRRSPPLTPGLRPSGEGSRDAPVVAALGRPLDQMRQVIGRRWVAVGRGRARAARTRIRHPAQTRSRELIAKCRSAKVPDGPAPGRWIRGGARSDVTRQKARKLVDSRQPATRGQMLVGRDAECDQIAGLLTDARRGHSGTLLLFGEPGVGKTALCTWALEQANGMRVLTARGVESEIGISYAGLRSLCADDLTDKDRLPEPQARALWKARSPVGVRRRRIGLRSAPRFSACFRPPPSGGRCLCSSTMRSGSILRRPMHFCSLRVGSEKKASP